MSSDLIKAVYEEKKQLRNRLLVLDSFLAKLGNPSKSSVGRPAGYPQYFTPEARANIVAGQKKRRARERKEKKSAK